MKRPTALLVLLASLVAGCATSYTTSSPPPSVRCVSDPNERGTRPLIFLFCIQSP
jgi:hypothetical protein